MIKYNTGFSIKLLASHDLKQHPQRQLSGIACAPYAARLRFNPGPRHIKDVITIVRDASLLSAQQLRIGMASLSSYKSEMEFICDVWSRVLTIRYEKMFIMDIIKPILHRRRAYNRVSYVGIQHAVHVCCLHLKMEFCSCPKGCQWCGIIYYH